VLGRSILEDEAGRDNGGSVRAVAVGDLLVFLAAANGGVGGAPGRTGDVGAQVGGAQEKVVRGSGRAAVSGERAFVGVLEGVVNEEIGISGVEGRGVRCGDFIG